MTFEKTFDGMMVGLIAKFPGHDADDFSVMNRGIELLHVAHIGSHCLRIDMAFPSGLPGALVDQPKHPFHHKPAGFVAHAGPLDTGLPAAFDNGFRKQDDRANDFVIVLNVIDELELVLGKILRSRHVLPPSGSSHSRTTASLPQAP